MIYLDHAATTPPHPDAIAQLVAWQDAANASATHTAGQQSRAAVEHAREQVADVLGCSPHDVIFTSGGTEADNLAIKGVVWAATSHVSSLPHVVTTAVEHPAVRETVRWLAQRGEITFTEVAPTSDGRCDIDQILDAVTEHTVLVSVMTANNEVGALNDIQGLARELADQRAVLHTDAVQALATCPVDVGQWGVDALAASAHKIGGPQGVGVAVLRRGLAVEPLLHGGGQDRGVRSGTFATGLIAACGVAMVRCADGRQGLKTQLSTMSARLFDGLLALDGVRPTGPTDPSVRLASHVHVMIDRVDANALVLELDRAGMAAATGSACGSGAAKASHVLEAMGAVGTPLRLTLGRTTTNEDIERSIDVLTDVIPRLQANSKPLVLVPHANIEMAGAPVAPHATNQQSTVET